MADGKWAIYPAAGFIIAASGLAILVSAACNFAYGLTQGTDTVFLLGITTRQLNSFGFLALDLGVVGFWGVLPWLLRNKFWLASFLIGLLAAPLTFVAFTNTMGFLGMEKASAEAHRSHDAGGYAALQAEVVRAKDALDWVKKARDAAVIGADISAREQREEFTRTKGCRDITRDDSRKFCDELADLRTEQSKAGTRDRLTIELRTAEAKLSAAKPVVSSDSLAVAAHDLFGFREDNTIRYKPFVGALALCLLATFGLAAAEAVLASGSVQASPSAPVAAEAPRPAAIHLPMPLPALEGLPEGEDDIPTGPVIKPQDNERKPSRPKETAAGQQIDAPAQPDDQPDEFETAVAQFAWGLKDGEYEIADLRARFKSHAADRGIAIARINQVGTLMEKLGYPKARAVVAGKKVTVVRVQKRLAKAG